MTQNFFEFHDLFVESDKDVAKAMHEDFCKRHANSVELDCNLLTQRDFENLLLMEEFLGQEEVFLPKLAKELFKKPRSKHMREIQNSCKDTLKKMPKIQPKRQWIHRYDPDPRSPEQIEEQHLWDALIVFNRDGLENFALQVAGNLDLMASKREKN